MRNCAGADVLVNIICGHAAEVVGFKIHFDDLLREHAGIAQMLCHQLQQTGFSAAADAGNDLDRLRVLKADQLIQI